MSPHAHRPRHAHRRNRRSRVLRALLPVLVIVGALVGATTAAAGISGYLHKADPDNPTAIRGCVIRFDQLSDSRKSVVPRIHANDSHACVGVTSVAVDWSAGSSYGDLVINNSGGSNNVITTFAEEDETLAKMDIQCGPSGGGTTTRIRCYRDGVKIPAQSLAMYGPNVNLWVGWTMWMDES